MIVFTHGAPALAVDSDGLVFRPLARRHGIQVCRDLHICPDRGQVLRRFLIDNIFRQLVDRYANDSDLRALLPGLCSPRGV